MRCLWPAIFIERAVATIYCKEYEHGSFWGLSFSLPIIFCGLAEIIVATRFVCKHEYFLVDKSITIFLVVLNEYFLHAIRISIDILGCTVSLLFKIFIIQGD